MRLVNILGASSVQHPEHGTAEAGPDGVFELPEAFGHSLLVHAAQWRTEAAHVAEAARKRLEELADPKRAAEVLDFVHGRVAEQATQIADLTDRLAALEGAAETPAESSAKTKTTK